MPKPSRFEKRYKANVEDFIFYKFIKNENSSKQRQNQVNFRKDIKRLKKISYFISTNRLLRPV